MPKPWTCKECGTVNVRTRSVTCKGCGKPTKRKLPVPKHRAVLRSTDYGDFAVLSVLIHGGEPHSCGVCGKPKPAGRRWDRDHDHRTGRPRGIACGGNQGCNPMMLPYISTGVAAAICAALQREGRHPEALRWAQITDYLRRVDSFYASRAQAGAGA
jgi:hypothetical protein